MADCVFCKIVEGSLSSKKIYEDEQVLAFYDICPQAPVHFLVVTKQHIGSVAEITTEQSSVVGHCFEIIAKLAADLNLRGGFRVISNTGNDAGQTVKHLHFHVLSGSYMGTELL